MGISPAIWLNQFGKSINLGRNGDAEVPLPLRGPQGFCYKWHVAVHAGQGGALQEINQWDGLYVSIGTEAPLPVKDSKTTSVQVSRWLHLGSMK